MTAEQRALVIAAQLEGRLCVLPSIQLVQVQHPDGRWLGCWNDQLFEAFLRGEWDAGVRLAWLKGPEGTQTWVDEVRRALNSGGPL